MIETLIRKFIEDADNTTDMSVRESYGRFAGIVGIISNAVLAVLKGTLGLMSGSIAIIADAVNNLTDAVSSIATLIGFKLAARERDKEHPYGHARMEYMTGIFIAAVIIVVGFKLLSDSYNRVFEHDPVTFNIVSIIILIVSIAIKVWQTVFNRTLALRIKSLAIKAAATDSRNDVIATTVVLVALLIGKLTGVYVDGYLGFAVAIFIIYSGIKLIRETSQPLLGKAPDPELVKRIIDLALSSPGVMGVHDLIVHDYGPGRIFASIHIEVDAAEDVLKSHEVVDEIETKAMNELHVELVGHMDPIDTKDPLVQELREAVTRIIMDIDGIVGMHDLRIVRGENHTNVIFDVVITEEGDASKDEIKEQICRQVAQIDSKYLCVIKFDTDYTA